ncbi:hypothetical protein BST61_g11314 [Cercospora zeina]
MRKRYAYSAKWTAETLILLLQSHNICSSLRPDAMDASRLAMEEALKELYEGGDYSDLTVICGPKRFKVHKAIVCTRCHWFASACQEGRWKEGAENVIYLEAEKNNAQAEEIEKDNPEAVQRMLEFLYLHNYSGGSITLDTDTVHHGTELILHAKVYSAGCKYNIPTLKMAAVDKFRTAAKLHWELDVFCEAVRIVFTTTPNSDNELREVVATIICSHNTILGASTEIDEANSRLAKSVDWLSLVKVTTL